MSKEKKTIEITPPKFYGGNNKGEIFVFHGFTCTYCNGNGQFKGKQIDHDNYEVKTCNICKGTGYLQANVVVGWVSDNTI